MPNLTNSTLSSLDPDPFGYTPPDVSGGNYTYTPPPPAPVQYDAGGYSDPFSTSNPGYVPGAGPVAPTPAPTYYAPPTAPTYAYSDQSFIDSTQPALPSYGTAPAPTYYNPFLETATQNYYQAADAPGVYPGTTSQDAAYQLYQGDLAFGQNAYDNLAKAQPSIYAPQEYQPQAAQYVYGAQGYDPSQSADIASWATDIGAGPITTSQIQDAAGKYSLQQQQAEQRSFFAGEQNQQSQLALQAMDPVMRQQLGYRQVTDPGAENFGQWVYYAGRDISEPVDYSLKGLIGGATIAPAMLGLKTADTLSNLQKSGSALGFDIPDLPGPKLLNDAFYSAVSPASVASFGLGAAGEMGLKGAIQQAATRGLPAIFGATAGSEYAGRGAEAAGLPDWAVQGASLAGGLVGGAAGWQAPEIAGSGASAARAAGRALAESPTVQAAAQGARAGLLGPAGLITGAVPGQPGAGSRAVASLSDEGAAALQKVNDALREEIRIRRSGTAATEISAGRGRQAQGIREGFNDALGMGKTYEETLAQTAAGARTGQLRKTVAAAIDLSESEKLALLNDIQSRAIAQGKDFEAISGGFALDKLIRGQGLQPAEIKTLGRYFGNEIEALAADVTKTRASAIADLSPEAVRRIAEAKATGESTIVRQVEIAKAQHALADELQAAARMDPTNKRLASLVDEARVRAKAAEANAEQLHAERAQNIGAKVFDKNIKAEQSAKAAAAKKRLDDANALMGSIEKGRAELTKQIDEAQRIGADAHVAALKRAQKAQAAAIKAAQQERAAAADDLMGSVREGRRELYGKAEELSPEAQARVNRRAEQATQAQYRETEAAIARQEEIARAEHARADRLSQAAAANNDQHLAKTANIVRARAIKAATEADRMEADLAQRAWDDLENKRVRDVAKGNAAGAKAASKAAEAADKLNPSQAQVLEEVRRVMAEVPSKTPRGTVGGVEPLNREAVNALENWMRSQNTLTTAVSDETGRISSFVSRTIQGNTADSFTTAVLVQREILESALKQTGMDETIARKVANMMSEWSVRQRLPDSTPASVVAKERTRIINAERAKGATLEAAQAKADAEVAARFNTNDRAQRVLAALKEADEPASRLADAASTLSSEWKNTMFGIGDVAVLGQQGIKAGSVAWPNIVAGLVNRILASAHLPSLDVTTNGLAVGKRTQEILDGVRHNVATGIVDPEAGTLLRRLPFVGKQVDAPITAAIGWMTDLQFNKVLGNIRSLNYEGNLVLLKALGQDVTDPAVRAAAAASANVHTSAGQLALRASRRTVEQGFLLSPSMRRAQIQEIGQLLRALGPGASGAERILAASAAFSIATSVLAVGKLVNDTIGLGEFEFDPSKPGFGKITIPTPGGGSRVVSVFPQVQLASLLARSSRALAEGDTETLKKQLGSFSLASMSPVAGSIAKNFGFGFDPDQGGWAFGDYGSGSDWKSRLANSLPIPPIAQALIQGERNPLGIALNVAGVSSYPESAYSEASRKAGVESFYRDLTKEEQQAFLLDPKNADVARKLAEEEKRRLDEAKGAIIGSPEGLTVGFEALRQAKATRDAAQADAAQQFAADGDGKAFREALADASQAYRVRADTAGQWLIGDRPASTAEAAALSSYFGAADPYRNSSGKITDYDAMEAAQAAAYAALTPEGKAAVDEVMNRTNPNTPQAVTDYYAALDKIEASGYWDVRDEVYQKWLKAVGATFTGTQEQYWDAVRKDAEQKAIQLLNSRNPNWRQIDPGLLTQTTDVFYNQAYGKFSGYVSEAQQAWRLKPENREVARLLALYGYAGTGKGETGVRIGELAR